jgi:hypothetical protein
MMKPQMNQRRALWAALLLSALAAPVLMAPAAAGIFSKSKKTPTTGVREPVLNYEAKPVAEPELADLAIVLPAPTLNTNWAQPGGNESKSMGHLMLPDTLTKASVPATGASMRPPATV